MTHPFLETAKATLLGRLETENFEKSVSLRIKDVGNLMILGHGVEISDAPRRLCDHRGPTDL